MTNERESGLSQGLGVVEQRRHYGPQLVDGGVSFNLWAPSARSVELLEVGRPPRQMGRDNEGW